MRPMLLHVYLEHVLGNKVAVALLRTMMHYRGKVFTVRGLANVARVSISETALTVHDLEKLGIINIQPIGRAYHLELNEKSYIFNKIIEPIVNAEKNTIHELIQTLRKHLDTKKIITAAIFGSVASAEEKMDSDIDLLIISNDHDHAIAMVSEAERPISVRFNGNLSPIIFTEKEFRAKQRGSFVQSIIGNHILISGKRIVPGK